MSVILDAALSYAKRGWYVLPVHGIVDGKCACGVENCSSPGKHPVTKDGLKSATTNETIIRNWWRVNPTANVAIRTGAESGLVVLDYDGQEGVALADTMNSLPTPRVITGSGGKHKFFAHPGGGTQVGNRAHVLPGLDIRADGGYVVTPPSKHVSGGTYRWENGFAPEDTDPAPLPEDVVALLSVRDNPVIDAEIVDPKAPAGRPDAPDENVKRARQYLSKMPAGVSGEGGHDATFAAAVQAAHGFHLSYGQAMTLMREFNTRCQPPWPEKDLEHKVTSAFVDVRDPGVFAKITAKPDTWMAKLQQHSTKSGGLITLPILFNATLYVENDRPVLTPRWDAFSGKIMVGDRSWTEADLNEMNCWLQETGRELYVGSEITQRAVSTVAHRREYHPVRDWLAGLEWDKTPRIETWLIRFAGAKDTPYVRAVSSRWLIGAVARVMRPGCRMDTMLILEGPQGSRKSTLVDVLGRPWAVGLTNGALHSEAAIEQLQGKWIVEMAELDGLRRSEVETTKDFLSRVNDNYRPKYARVSEDHPRQCVFMGTTNGNTYLQDVTGNRRFWPVEITRTIDTDGVLAERDQLWAEAVSQYYAGVPWHLTEDEEALARVEQADRVPDDAWEATIGPWIDGQLTELPLLQGEVSLSVAEILKGALDIAPAFHDKPSQMRVSAILKKMGWVKYTATAGKKQQKRWKPKPSD